MVTDKIEPGGIKNEENNKFGEMATKIKNLQEAGPFDAGLNFTDKVNELKKQEEKKSSPKIPPKKKSGFGNLKDIDPDINAINQDIEK